MAGDLSKAPAVRTKAPGTGGPDMGGMENATKVLSAIKDVGTDLLKGNAPGAALRTLDKVADMAQSMDGSAGFTKQITGYASALGSGNPLSIAQKGFQTVTSGGKPSSGGGGLVQGATKGGEAALSAASKATDAADAAGSAASTAGSTTQAAASGGKAAGTGLKAGGGLLSMTVIGSIIGVPMKIVGAGTTVAATGVSAAGTGLKAAGSAVRITAKVTKTTLQAVRTVLKALRRTVETLQKGTRLVRKPLKAVSKGTRTFKSPLKALRKAKATAGKALKVTSKSAKTLTFPARTALRTARGGAEKAKNLLTAVNDLSEASIQAGKGDLGKGAAHLKAAGQKAASTRELTAPVKQSLAEGKAIHSSWKGERPSMPSEQRQGVLQRLFRGQAEGKAPSTTALAHAASQPRPTVLPS